MCIYIPAFFLACSVARLAAAAALSLANNLNCLYAMVYLNGTQNIHESTHACPVNTNFGNSISLSSSSKRTQILLSSLNGSSNYFEKKNKNENEIQKTKSYENIPKKSQKSSLQTRTLQKK